MAFNYLVNHVEVENVAFLNNSKFSLRLLLRTLKCTKLNLSNTFKLFEKRAIMLDYRRSLFVVSSKKMGLNGPKIRLFRVFLKVGPNDFPIFLRDARA